MATILFPLWSVLSQLIATALLVGIQRQLKRRFSQHFDVLNEFVCYCMWLWWTQETVLLGSISILAAILALFIRLVIYPYISEGSPNSPCTALYFYWTGDRKRKNNFQRLCVSLLASLAAIPVSLVFCHYYWMLLGLTVSRDHYSFLQTAPNYFLNASPLYGVLYELVPSFLMFVPSIVTTTQSLAFVVCDSVVVVSLVYGFRGFTGAFMNPMSALALSLYWHSLTLVDYGTHMLVFWVGPFIGTWAAAKVKLFYDDYKNRKLV